MRLTSQRTLIALPMVLVSLFMAMLACTSNDTLFIHLTDTPAPSITPTPLTQETRFKIGDKTTVVLVSDFASMHLASFPGLSQGSDESGNCFSGQSASILNIGKSSDTNDPKIYYQISCSGKPGWIGEANLSRFAKSGKALIKAADGGSVKLYSQPSLAASPVSETACTDGLPVTISALQTSKVANDINIYLQVTCGSSRGFVTENDVVPVAK